MNSFCLTLLPLIAQVSESEETIDAQAAVPKSYLIICGHDPNALFYLLIAVSGLMLLFGALRLVTRCEQPAPILACFAFLPTPLLIATLGALKNTVAYLSIIATSDTTLRPDEICGGLAELLVLFFYGLLATVPAYAILTIGLFVRVRRAGRARVK
jgi:hypothetical protein